MKKLRKLDWLTIILSSLLLASAIHTGIYLLKPVEVKRITEVKSSPEWDYVNYDPFDEPSEDLRRVIQEIQCDRRANQ